MGSLFSHSYCIKHDRRDQRGTTTMNMLHHPKDFEYWQYNKQANIVYLSTVGAFFLMLPLFYLIGSLPVFLMNTFSAATALIAFYLNQKNMYAFASLLFIFVITAQSIAHTIILGLGIGFTYYFFNMSILIVFTNWSNKAKLIGVMMEAFALILVFFVAIDRAPIVVLEPLSRNIFHSLNVIFNISGVAHSAYLYMNLANSARLQLEDIANTDYLTKLYNRFSMNQTLAHQIQSRKSGLGILMIDIDHFKKINDRYGHLFGDEVLKHVANLIKQMSRSEDIVVRYGGEEFALFMEIDSIDSLKVKAERLRKAVEKNPIHHGGEQVHITISIGAHHEKVTSSLNLEACLDIADLLLYQAKANGRNQVVATQS